MKMADGKEMHLVNPGGDPAIWVFHDRVGDDGVCGISLARAGGRPETACLTVSRQAYTQEVMFRLFSEHAQLYEPATSLLAVGALRPGDVAIDIGAHVGYFSMLFRLAVGPTGSVYAFEPMPETYRRLLRNVMLNRYTNVLPLPLAMADRSGTAVFHIDTGNEGECSLLETAGNQTVEVQVTSLDDLFRDGLPARPRVMKMDAEGVELSILNGGRQFFEHMAPDMVICEINRGALAKAGIGEPELREFFESRDYRCAVVALTSVDAGIDFRGARFYRYLDKGEFVSDACQYVFNLMCVRAGSGLYPANLV